MGTIILFILIFLIAFALLGLILTPLDISWTQKDKDDGDKQYGFMCYACDEPLEDGEGIPRLCAECQKEEDDTHN